MSITSRNNFYRAKKYIAGGVNSPVRSFNAVGGQPVFINKASGSRLYDEYGKGFIDYCMSWGALLLGHAHPKVIKAIQDATKKGTSFGAVTTSETELAKLIVEAVQSIERVRLTSSGTEAVMSAIRLARAYTGKNKIIKFEGSYHGHADCLLAKRASIQTTLGIPHSLGVPKDFTRHTVVLPYNNIEETEKAVKKYHKDLAAIIVEPVAANCGIILPKRSFLEGLRSITQKYGILLIFDEVITGFRISFGGAQEYFDVKPDLTCLGKIIGGGLPVGAFGGKKEIMKLLAPEGDVYQAGTFSGNPISVIAGITTLNVLKKQKPYESLEIKTRELCGNVYERFCKYGVGARVNYIGSMFSIFFTDKDVTDYASARLQNLRLFNKFYRGILKQMVYFSPSGFEANFLSASHTREDLRITLVAIDNFLKNLRR